jgi:Na+/proline symporter
MSSVDSGLNSICTLLVMDLHRRYGWGKAWLARRIGKTPEDLDEVDELRLARPLTLVIGIGATLFSLVIAQIGEVFEIMIAVVNTFGAPLLAIFLLGMFTRRCTGAAALIALVAGTLFTLYLMAVNRFAFMAVVWPFEVRCDSIWTVTFGTLFTLVCGYVLSFFVGKRKPNIELRGLVVGCGTLGVLAADEDVQLLSTDSHRWK